MIRPRHLLFAAVAFAASPAMAADEEWDCSFTADDRKVITLSQDCFDMVDAKPNDADKADLLFRLAYELNERESTVTALPLLDRAVALVPDNPRYLQERGFTKGDLGFYRDAAADLDKALSLDADMLLALSERGWTRFQYGDFEGSVADYAKAEELGGAKSDYILGRAEPLIWLGRLDEAERELAKLDDDADSAKRIAELRKSIARQRAFHPAGDPGEACTTGDVSDKQQAAAIVDACTAAFLSSSDAAKRADFLTARATASVIEESGYDAAIADYKIAAGLDPAEPNWHFNLGYALLQIRHSWAARNEFNKALELGLRNDQTKALALAGRAQANYNLNDADTAFADAKAAYEVQPNPAALEVLGDLAFDRDDKKAAKTFWLNTYRMGERDDRLLERLASVGVTDPDREPAPEE
jgi:tetratricopeptide (TPR) repeat protein